MAKEKEAIVQEESAEAVEPKSKTPVKKREPKEKLSLEQFFARFMDNVHPYTRAYFYPKYHGILKSKDEWDQELEGKL